MRALCGAIITAGAMLGLGLAAQGIGARYAHENVVTKDQKPVAIHLSEMDPPLVFALVFAACVAVIGLGIAFVGLAYHHHRREREHQWEREKAGVHQRTAV